MPASDRTFLQTDADAVLWPPADPGAGAHWSVAPSAALAPYVARVRVGHETLPAGAPLHERVLPDGTVHLLFNLGDAPTVLDGGDAHAASSTPCQVFGATGGPTMLRMAGHVEMVGVDLSPGGALALLGVPAGALAERTVALDELWGPLAGETYERLCATPRGPARIAVMERALRERLRRAAGTAHGDAHPGAAAAVRLIAASGGRRSVRELAASVGVGERRLEQLFHAHVGQTPKQTSRLARFHATVRLLRREPGRRWSEIAHRCGYADHAHLTHEYRALTGLTPTAFRRELGFGFPQDAPLAAR